MPAQPPPLPPDLVARLGPSEELFGPNLRFRTQSTLLGGFLVVLGLVGFVFGGLRAAAHIRDGQIYLFFGMVLMAVGSAAVILPRRAPLRWTFICARGLAQSERDGWRTVEWTEVRRATGVSMTSGVATIRQFRLDLTDGTEMGFLGDYVADYRRLSDVLRAKVAAAGGRTDSGEPGA
jgi:hypothetical protein